MIRTVLLIPEVYKISSKAGSGINILYLLTGPSGASHCNNGYIDTLRRSCFLLSVLLLGTKVLLAACVLPVLAATRLFLEMAKSGLVGYVLR